MRASERVERRRATRAPASTMRTQVAKRTPASAARGMVDTSGAARKTSASSTSEWVMAARRDVAPARTLTAVRAIAAVAGHAPEQRDHHVGEPLPEELAVGVVVLVDGHGVGDRRAEQALERGERRDGERSRAEGADGAEVDEGQRRSGQARGEVAERRRVQVEGAGQTVASATPRRENGTRGRHRAPTSISPATPRAMAGEPGGDGAAKRWTASAALAQTFSPEGSLTPSAAGTCWRAMTTAMPAVKPSMTETGR